MPVDTEEKFCHQCHTKKLCVKCTAPKCNKAYCEHCCARHSTTLAHIAAEDEWACFGCQSVCTCAPCKKKAAKVAAASGGEVEPPPSSLTHPRMIKMLQETTAARAQGLPPPCGIMNGPLEILCPNPRSKPYVPSRTDSSTSPFRGVSSQGSRWRARICIDKIEYGIGDFDTEDAAAKAYDLEAIRRGKLRALNFIYRGINEELMTEVDKVLQAAAAATGGLLMGADGMGFNPAAAAAAAAAMGGMAGAGMGGIPGMAAMSGMGAMGMMGGMPGMASGMAGMPPGMMMGAGASPDEAAAAAAMFQHLQAQQQEQQYANMLAAAGGDQAVAAMMMAAANGSGVGADGSAAAASIQAMQMMQAAQAMQASGAGASGADAAAAMAAAAAASGGDGIPSAEQALLMQQHMQHLQQMHAATESSAVAASAAAASGGADGADFSVSAASAPPEHAEADPTDAVAVAAGADDGVGAVSAPADMLAAGAASMAVPPAAPVTALDPDAMPASEDFCFQCGSGGNLICCDTCPRVFHQACLGLATTPDEDLQWSCPVCVGRVGPVSQSALYHTNTAAVKSAAAQHQQLMMQHQQQQQAAAAAVAAASGVGADGVLGMYGASAEAVAAAAAAAGGVAPGPDGSMQPPPQQQPEGGEEGPLFGQAICATIAALLSGTLTLPVPADASAMEREAADTMQLMQAGALNVGVALLPAGADDGEDLQADAQTACRVTASDAMLAAANATPVVFHLLRFLHRASIMANLPQQMLRVLRAMIVGGGYRIVSVVQQAIHAFEEAVSHAPEAPEQPFNELLALLAQVYDLWASTTVQLGIPVDLTAVAQPASAAGDATGAGGASEPFNAGAATSHHEHAMMGASVADAAGVEHAQFGTGAYHDAYEHPHQHSAAGTLAYTDASVAGYDTAAAVNSGADQSSVSGQKRKRLVAGGYYGYDEAPADADGGGDGTGARYFDGAEEEEEEGGSGAASWPQAKRARLGHSAAGDEDDGADA